VERINITTKWNRYIKQTKVQILLWPWRLVTNRREIKV